MTATDHESAAPDASPSVEPRAASGEQPHPEAADLDPIPTEVVRVALNKIAWHLAQLRRLACDHADIRDRFNTEIERIERLRNDRLEVIERDIEHRTSLIQAAHLALHGAGMVDKTIHTPHGTSKLREPKAAQVFAPDRAVLDALIPWADEHHPHIVKRSLGIGDVRKVVTAREDGTVIDKTTGEVLEGLIAEIPRPTVSVHPDEGAPL